MKTKVIKAVAKGLLLGAALIAVAALAGCSFTVYPDGSKSGTLDGAQTAEVIRILATK